MTEGLPQGREKCAARCLDALVRPVDGAWLVAFRVLFGVAMSASLLRFIAYGWVERFFVQPRFHFKYWGFEWVRAAPPDVMHALFWVLAGLALCVAAGFLFRVAASLFVIGFAYLQLVDLTNYLNHYYLASLLGLLLAVSPAHRSCSVDALFRQRRQRERRAGPEGVAAAWLYLFRFQVGVVYVFAGLAKLNADWLLHAQPLGIWLAARTDLPLLGPLFALPWAPHAMSWAGFLFDTSIVAWLLWSKTRAFAYVAVMAFHVVTRLLFPIGMFPVIMTLSALVFFSPAWPRRWTEWLVRRRASGARAKREAPSSGGAGRGGPAASGDVLPARRVDVLAAPGTRRVAALALAGAYCLCQLALPLRFLFYSGNVRWDEQGMRFSWRVMVREKNGSVTFVVRNERSGRVFHVSPRHYLTPLQEREMAGQPDLILQLSHHIRDDFARRGLGPVEVRADALVSLNGRPIAPLIDPDADLARIRDGLGKASFVAPAPRRPPPRIRPI
ncbi:MAG TPA: HTTM domain-containing protein [Polyangiaceae bacterium]